VASWGVRLQESYAPPRDGLRLSTDDPLVLALADRLWARGPAGGDAVAVTVAVESESDAAPDEADVVWELEEGLYRVRLGDALSARVDLERHRVDASVSRGLLERAPAVAARYLLEGPTAVLFERRAFRVLHAGAIVGERGAVVLRGASGAGKSTLVALAHREGYDVLGDESLLVSREDPDDLASSVRDLTVLPDAARLLNIAGEPCFSGGEDKVRVPLFGKSAPEMRRARRVATLLLGRREPGPARLRELLPWEFREVFREGEIPQEWTAGDPVAIAAAWSGERSFLLEGAVDLQGVLELVKRLAGDPSTRIPSA